MAVEKLIESMSKFKEEAYNLNYYLAENPEISEKEFNSSRKIVEILNNYGINTTLNFCNFETAFFGNVIKKENAKYNFAILVEYDALPDIGHACGHSSSAAISILSALALKENEELIDANVDIIGTPGEEDEGLKSPMADMCVFDKYHAVIMVHLTSGKNKPNGKFLALDTYEISFKGKPAHCAGSPWQGRSALDGLMLSIHAFDMMRKSLKPGAIVEGIVLNGGSAPGMIPEFAKAKYAFRARNYSEVKDEIMPWVKDILDGCAKATQTEYKLETFGYTFRDMVYNQTGTNLIKEIMEDNNLEYEEMDFADGSSDIGSISYRAPAFHPYISISEEEIPFHTKKVADFVKSDGSKNVIDRGARIILEFFGRLLENPSKIKEIRKEFEESLVKN